MSRWSMRLIGGTASLALAFVVVRCSDESTDREVRPSSGIYESKNDADDGSSTDGGSETAQDVATVTDGSTTFEIFSYEAVVVDGKAISKAGVVPTVSVDATEAAAACLASGYRLCTQSEWTAACKGPEQLKFGYAATADGPPAVTEACDVARTTDNSPGSLPSKTGTHPECVTKGLAVYDMVGNASEWANGSGDKPVAMGVAFYQAAADSHCEASLTGGGETMDPAEKSTDLGFRCCK